MATVLFGTSAGTPGISPPRSSTWSRQCSQFGRNLADTVDVSSAVSKGDASSVSGIQSTAGYQFIYGPLAAQTLSGTVTTVIRGRSTTYVNIYTASTCVWVATAAGGVRGTARAETPYGALWGTSYVNYTSSALALSSVTVQAGDFLVLEAGWDSATYTDFDRGNISIGGNVGKWTFSANIELLVGGLPNALMLMGAGT